MKRALFILLILLPPQLWALSDLPQSDKRITGFDPKGDFISDEYLAGPFLIYNCQKKHWVCVMEEYFEDCKRMRQEDERLDKEFARCAPIAGMAVKFSCFQEQLRLTTHVEPAKLCVLEKWKARNINFD